MTDKNILIGMYTTMLKIRLAEERIAELVAAGEVKCPCHLYIGQEAVAAGVCASLRNEDVVFGTHRSHGHYLAKGGDLTAMMAELYGRASGCSKGCGGSMHLIQRNVGFEGSSAIVGGTIPLALGAALAFQTGCKENVSVAFFGDGAAMEGVLYESLNFASLRKLPIVFVCENNLYSTHMHISAIQGSVDIWRRAEAFNIPSCRVDGNDASQVYKAAEKAVDAARDGCGPSFLECMTYRWRGHVGPADDIDKGLRSQDELERWMHRCPIKMLETRLIEAGIISESDKNCIRSKLINEIEEAVTAASKAPLPDSSDYVRRVFKQLSAI